MGNSVSREERISSRCHGLCGGACVGMCNENDNKRQDIYDRSKKQVVQSHQIISKSWLDLPFYENKSSVATHKLYEERVKQHDVTAGDFKPNLFEQLDYDERKLLSLSFGQPWTDDPVLEKNCAITPERLGIVRGEIVEREVYFLSVLAKMDNLVYLLQHEDKHGDFSQKWQETFLEVSQILENPLYNVHSEERARDRAPSMGQHLLRKGVQLRYDAQKIDAAIGQGQLDISQQGGDVDIHSVVNARPIRRAIIASRKKSIPEASRSPSEANNETQPKRVQR
jgi:hypothetical protein